MFTWIQREIWLCFGRDSRAQPEIWTVVEVRWVARSAGTRGQPKLGQAADMVRCCIRFLQQGAARHWSAVAIGTRWVWEVCATTRAANLAPATDPVGSLALDGIGCRRKSPHAAKQPGARADARTGGRRPVAISHVRARAETCGATRRRRRGALPRRYDPAAVGFQPPRFLCLQAMPAGCCG